MEQIPFEKIAILMATYNGEKYLRQQVESIMNQTYQKFVLVIHDDGSTDKTPELISQLVDEYEPGKIIVLQGKSCGSAKANFMWMLAHVEADYYMFADQDDVWLPEKIEKTMKRYLEIDCDKDNYNLIFTDMAVVDENLKEIYPSFIRSIDRDINHVWPGQLIIDNVAAGCTMLFGRDLRDVIVDSMEDIDLSKVEMHDRLLITVASVLGLVYGIDEPLSLYRQHGDNEMGAVHETLFDKVARNIKGIVTGERAEGHAAFIKGAQDFAGEVYKVCVKAYSHRNTEEEHSYEDFYRLTEINWIEDYAHMGEKNLSRNEKIDFYMAHHLERATEEATYRMYKWI